MARKKYNAQDCYGNTLYIKPCWAEIVFVGKQVFPEPKPKLGKKIDLCPFSELPLAA